MEERVLKKRVGSQGQGKDVKNMMERITVRARSVMFIGGEISIYVAVLQGIAR